MYLYQNILRESYDERVPAPLALEQQTKLLRCLHLTEVFRNQWELAFNDLIRMTQDMMHKLSLFKEIKSTRHVENVMVPSCKGSPELVNSSEEDNQWTIIFTFFSFEIGSIQLNPANIFTKMMINQCHSLLLHV